MKKLLFLLAFLPLSVWAYQQPARSNPKQATATRHPVKANSKPAVAGAQTAPGNKAGTITLACRLISIPSSADTLRLYEYLGLAKRVVANAVIRPSDSAYVFTLPMGKPRFYGVGFYENSTAKVLLGEEPQLTLWANAQFMDKARTSGSPANKMVEQLRKDLTAFQLRSSQAHEIVSLAYGSGGNKTVAAGEVEKVTKSKTRYLDSLKVANPLLWQVATLYLTPDFKGDSRGMAAETDFIGANYFRNANLADKTYAEIPDLFTAGEQYAAALLSTGATEDQFKQLADAQLTKIGPGTLLHRIVLGGMISALKAANSKLFPVYATAYLNQYRSASYGEIGPLEFDMRRSNTYMSGTEAPDLAGMTPDSTTYALSSMRGKIVLVDFWASWCGPCRREMPTVVQAYKKYKDKGFDILGVSLDRDMPSWKKAIEQDGLPWHHISDLRGWQSQHAQLYSINSIPATVLVDKEGKIIARNLRGGELDAKLREIFGE